jgi:gluconolactonase
MAEADLRLLLAWLMAGATVALCLWNCFPHLLPALRFSGFISCLQSPVTRVEGSRIAFPAIRINTMAASMPSRPTKNRSGFTMPKHTLSAAMFLVLVLPAVADDAKTDIVPKDAKLEQVATGCKFTEGPAGDADGNLFFTDSPNQRIMVLRPDGKLEVWDKKSGDANGTRFDAKGRLVACCGEDGARAVIRYEKDGARTTLADKYNGKRLTAPNDLCMDKQGRIYFTDPCYGKRPKDGQEKYAVYRIDATDGEPVANKLTRVIDDVDTPNGICIAPDNKTLYVADNAARKDGPHTLVAYDIAADGACKRRGVLHDFKDHRGIDGMVLDTNGNIYATAEDGKLSGVYIFSPAGKQLGFLPTPETATNCTFGDKDLKTLYVTAGKSVYKVRLNATGFLAYPTPK